MTHTNDLANCAKVNSVLHSLVTPLIYSRFDIVWPETLSSADSARGVDALTVSHPLRWYDPKARPI